MAEIRYNKLGVGIIFLFAAISFFLILFFWKRLPNKIPLFYSRPWGEEELAQPQFLYILPLGSLVMLLLDLAAAKILKAEGTIFAFIIWVTTIFSFMAFFTLIRIIFLIT